MSFLFCIVSEVTSCQDEKEPHEIPLLISGIWLGLRGSKSSMFLRPLKMQSVFGTREVPVKGASSRKWVIFTLLMNYFSRQACRSKSRLPEDKPPSHHSLTWVTFLNNIIHSLVYFLFLKKLFFFNTVNPKLSITMESVNSLQIFSHFPPKAL